MPIDKHFTTLGLIESQQDICQCTFTYTGHTYNTNLFSCLYMQVDIFENIFFLGIEERQVFNIYTSVTNIKLFKIILIFLIFI